MSRPLLSLAIIVKDQAELLSGLLQAHDGLYDEAIVVDTGSRDNSVAVARDWGARVISCQWRQDFSTPRNLGLQACHGRWVLILDCDEAISHGDQGRLRGKLQKSAPCCLILDQLNYTHQTEILGFVPVGEESSLMARGAPGYVRRQQIRVVPNGLGINFTGLIHENVEESLRTSGLSTSYESIAVHHYGHLEGVAGHLKRVNRNGNILRREIRKAPGDAVLLTEFAEQLVAEGNCQGAAQICRTALLKAPGHPELYRTRLLLARLIASQTPAEALSEIDRALQARPDLPECWREAVKMNLDQKYWLRADRLLAEASRVFPHDLVLKELKSQVLARSVDKLGAGNG